MKRLFALSMLLVTCCLPAHAAARLPYGPRFVLFQMGVEDSYLLRPKLDWKLYIGNFVGLVYGDVLLKGPDNSFNLSIQISYDDPDSPQYDTPEKLRSALLALTGNWYRESWERTRKIPHPALFREFAPAGRFGWVARFSARRWVGRTPPPEDPEGKYVTCGLFRSGRCSVMYFQLWSNSVDDERYYELLDFLAELALPEVGDLKWKVFHAQAAARLADAELARRFPGKLLRRQRPYTVRLDGSRWIVRGTRQPPTPEDPAEPSPPVVEAVIDGPGGGILAVSGSAASP